MADIGVGIIGAGWFGERHAYALQRAGGFRIAAACREDEAGLAAFTDRFGGRGHRSWEDILADPAVDAVVIATPHHLHAAMAVGAARAGKPILLEKPMAPTLADCAAIRDAVKGSGVPLLVGHTQRFARPVREAKALLARGELGAVRFGQSSMIKLWMEANRRPWHLRQDTGGGMLMTAGIHALDRLLWLAGSPVRSVYAVAQAAFHAQDVDDLATLVIKLDNGAVTTCTSVAYSDGAPFGGTDIVCDRGVLRLDPARGVEIGQGGAWRRLDIETADNEMDWALVDEWRCFRDMIRAGRESPVGTDEGFATVAVIEAALASARTGLETKVDHV